MSIGRSMASLMATSVRVAAVGRSLSYVAAGIRRSPANIAVAMRGSISSMVAASAMVTAVRWSLVAAGIRRSPAAIAAMAAMMRPVVILMLHIMLHDDFLRIVTHIVIDLNVLRIVTHVVVDLHALGIVIDVVIDLNALRIVIHVMLDPHVLLIVIYIMLDPNCLRMMVHIVLHLHDLGLMILGLFLHMMLHMDVLMLRRMVLLFRCMVHLLRCVVYWLWCMVYWFWLLVVVMIVPAVLLSSGNIGFVYLHFCRPLVHRDCTASDQNIGIEISWVKSTSIGISSNAVERD